MGYGEVPVGYQRRQGYTGVILDASQYEHPFPTDAGDERASPAGAAMSYTSLPSFSHWSAPDRPCL